MHVQLHDRKIFIWMMSVLLVLSLCSVNLIPGAYAEETGTASSEPETTIYVSSVDELLNAIGPDRVIIMSDGVYDLTQAQSYGQATGSAYWDWEYCYDGYQLNIHDVSGLWIAGSGSMLCSVVTQPRYANVLYFNYCSNITIRDMTAGHSPGEGYCTGGVLNFMNCDSVCIDGCDLYGCGTYGISAVNCASLLAENTTIRECSYGGLMTTSCIDVCFANGRVVNCGISKENGDDWIAFDLMQAQSCTGFYVLNTEISGNVVQTVFHSTSTADYRVSGCSVHDNTVGEHSVYHTDFGVSEYNWGAMFFVTGRPVTVSGTSFYNNNLIVPFFFNDADQNTAINPVTDENGNPLDQAALESMFQSPVDVESYKESQHQTGSSTLNGELSDAGWMVYHVNTADEFLSAIGSDTIIYIDAPLIDFNTSSNYGGYGGTNYYWIDNYDGPGLVLNGVENLKIIGNGKNNTVLQATPRYAEVLYFENCRDVVISDLTAGHLKEVPGFCMGDVFEFVSCSDITIERCGLFGCGVNGIRAQYCSDFYIQDTEIYECSEYAVTAWSCDHFSFTGCSIHDCGLNGIELYTTNHMLWNNQKLPEGFSEIQPEQQASAYQAGDTMVI